MLLSLPTGSLKDFTRYLMRLLGKGLKSNAVLTRFTLKKAVNAGGIAFSQAQFSQARVLTPEELTLVLPLSEQVKAFSARVGYDVEPVSEPASRIDPETGEIIEPLA